MNPLYSFVVRIYRRNQDHIAGVVEDVKTGRAQPFHSITDLWGLVTQRSHWRKNPANPGTKQGSAP
ncbi:hypothetical protein C7S18_08210 [Ahniella affigens]|uniref:Uncharacterized protein n=1 Tax=Ahniella affigens TaxID=2021234 RepID=A0A2P1PQP9_9GAMM|nr:hypothetical protein [Ahniella affigens]AVP97177.1 hypothetical protein C7S18_08210 [Ahniella affigens]